MGKKNIVFREGTSAEELQAPIGFKLDGVRNESWDDEEDAIVFRFSNDHNVAIDVMYTDSGSLFISEPYAVDADGNKL